MRMATLFHTCVLAADLCSWAKWRASVHLSRARRQAAWPRWFGSTTRPTSRGQRVGQVDPGAIDPDAPIPLYNLSPVAQKAHTAYQMGGAYFDAESRSLFVSEREGDGPIPIRPSP